MQAQQHWERVYESKAETDVSWFQPHAEMSVKLIRAAGYGPEGSVIDVGGGASTLVDDLLDEGYRRLTVLDLSAAALEKSRTRLGERAASVRWLAGDILDVDLPAQSFDVWHDRAVFHFLTSEEDRRAYVRTVLHAVKPGGFVIVATFAEDGPTQCSGLPVRRYAADELHAEFGAPFELVGHVKESHHTPGGKEQKFVYCFCRAQVS